MNTTMSLGSDVGLALAGIKLNVEGEEHLWSHRPAVFIFNHQSWLDGMIVMKLLREDVTAVAKKEVARAADHGPDRVADEHGVRRPRQHRAGQGRAGAGGRADRSEGYSLAISPEGTRSPTPRVGHFKKGAFHMAMQAGVPIVPIVIRNAGQLLWRGSTVMRQGTVDVARAAADRPSTTGRVEDLDAHVDGVREQFVDTLGGVADVTRPIQVTVLGARLVGHHGRVAGRAPRAHRAVGALARRPREEIRDEHRNYPLPARPRPAPRAAARRRRSPDAVGEADVLVVGVPVARPARRAARRGAARAARGSRS